MANSAINISANAQEVINLRKRIDELKAALSSMRQSADPKAYNKLNSELQTTSIRYYRLVGDIQRYTVAQQQAERATSKSSDSLTDLLKKGAALAGITFGAEKIRELGMEIVRVHGEMQQLNIAFSTMLKSQEKADALMSGLKTFATDTPFGLMDSAKGAKQLLAYGTTAENIIGDLKMLGNVASGVSAPLGDIVYLYGTLRSQGRAYAVDIRQFAGRGIPIYAELAKVLKVNVDQVNELVSAGKVGFPEVEQAFKNMTSGGGMFEGLMEKQTASVTGQIEKLKDNIQFMFDAIGTSSEGAIYGAIDGASTLVENYQAVGEALTALIATYGTYKAILIADTAMQGVRTSAMYTAEAAELSKLLTVEQAANVSKQNLTKGTAAYVAAIKAEIAAAAESAQSKLAEQQADLNALMTKREQAREQMVNSQAKVQLLKQELAQTIANTQAEVESSLKKRMAVESEKQSRAALSVVRLQERKDAAIEQARALKEQEASAEKIAAKNREIASIQAKIAIARQEEIQHGRNVAAARAELKAGVDLSANKAVQTATTSLNTATQQANSAATQYNTLQRRYQVDWDKVQATQQAVNTAVTNANTVATSANITVTQLLTAAKAKLWTATKNLFSVLVPNPYILVAAAVIGAGYAIYKYATYTTEAEKAINKFNEEARNQINELNGVFDAYKKANEGTEEKKKLLETIKTKYGDYIKDLIDEKGRITDIEAAQKLANKALKESIALKIRNESINDATTKEVKKQAGYLGQLRKIIAGTKGTETANTMVSKIGDIFSNESKSVRDSALEAQKYLTDAGISLDETSSFWGDSAGRVLSNIQASVQNARNERKDIEDSFRGLVKDDSKLKTGDESTPTIISTYNDQLKSAQDNVSKLEKDLANLRKGIRPVDIKADVQFDFSKNIEEKAKELKDAQDKLSYLTTGQSYSASNKANNAAETAAEKARKTAQKTLDDQLKLDNDKAKASLDARNQELENQQALLNLQEYGFEKEQKQAEINHQKELLSIDKRAQELIEAKQKAERDAWDIKNPNPKTTYVNKTVSSSDLLLGQQSELNNSRDIANRTQIKANADLLKNLLEKYQDFAAKKTAIEKQYNKDVQALESQRTAQNSAEIDRAVAQLNKERKEATSAIDLNAFKESINWEQAFGDLDKVSTSALEDLREKLRKYILTAGDSISIQDLKAVSEAIDGIDEKLKVKSPFSSLINGFKELSAAGKDATKQAIAYRKIINSLEEVNTLVDSLSQAFSDLSDAGIFSKKDAKNAQDIMGYLQGSVTASAGLGKVLSGDMSGIKDMISGTSQMIKSVASLFGKRDKAAEDTKQLQDITSKIEVTNKSINSLIEKRIDLINDATAAEAGYLNTLTQEQIKTQQEYVQGMFDRLSGNEIFGKKGKNNNLTLTALMDREGLTSMDDFVKWWNEEGGVAKLTAEGYDLKNEDQWQSIIDAWSSLKDAAEDAETAMKEAATGISFDDLKDSLDDLVQDVNTTFSDISDSFEDHMRNAVMNFVKSSYLTKALQDWYDKFAEAYSDDVLTSDEVDALQNMYNEAYNKAQDMYDSALKAAGVSKGSTSQSASSGYSTSMSQDTGEAIEGRMTAMQMNLISIDGNVARIAEWSQPFDMKYNVDVLTAPLSALSESCQRIELMLEQNRNIAIQSYYELKDINKQTKELYPMRIDTQAIRKSLESL
nr:MAG TPA: Tape measure domain protein [Caudoviricetes sp.]